MDTDRYINSKFKLINITANEAEKYREISDLNGWPSDTPLEKVKGWGIDNYKMDRIRKNDVTYQSLMKHTPVVSHRGFIINGNHRVARALEMGIDPIPILKELPQGVAEGLNQTTSQLGPQLYTPHPKNLDESMKPKAALWTSTASGGNNGYSSAWVEWAKSEMPQWVGHSGFLYDVSPGARILTINSDRDAMRVANKYGMNTTDIMDLFMYMPWKKIAKDYDAIHHVPANRGADIFMHSWDVESTAWFNPKMLLNKRKVPILASGQGNLTPKKLR
jgi:hypothetical protein